MSTQTEESSANFFKPAQVETQRILERSGYTNLNKHLDVYKIKSELKPRSPNKLSEAILPRTTKAKETKPDKMRFTFGNQSLNSELGKLMKAPVK